MVLLIWVLRYMIRRSRGETAGSRLLAGGRAPSGVASILARYPVARGQQVVLEMILQVIPAADRAATEPGEVDAGWIDLVVLDRPVQEGVDVRCTVAVGRAVLRGEHHELVACGTRGDGPLVQACCACL